MKILSTPSYQRLIDENRSLAERCKYLEYRSQDNCAQPPANSHYDRELLTARIRELEDRQQLLLLKIGLKGFSVHDVPAQPATIMVRKASDAA